MCVWVWYMASCHSWWRSCVIVVCIFVMSWSLLSSFVVILVVVVLVCVIPCPGSLSFLLFAFLLSPCGVGVVPLFLLIIVSVVASLLSCCWYFICAPSLFIVSLIRFLCLDRSPTGRGSLSCASSGSSSSAAASKDTGLADRCVGGYLGQYLRFGLGLDLVYLLLLLSICSSLCSLELSMWSSIVSRSGVFTSSPKVCSRRCPVSDR